MAKDMALATKFFIIATDVEQTMGTTHFLCALSVSCLCIVRVMKVSLGPSRTMSYPSSEWTMEDADHGRRRLQWAAPRAPPRLYRRLGLRPNNLPKHRRLGLFPHPPPPPYAHGLWPKAVVSDDWGTWHMAEGRGSGDGSGVMVILMMMVV